MLAKKKHMNLFSVCLFEINQALQEKETLEHNMVPPEQPKFLYLFLEKEVKELPLHRPYGHKILMQRGTKPPFRLQ